MAETIRKMCVKNRKKLFWDLEHRMKTTQPEAYNVTLKNTENEELARSTCTARRPDA